MVSPTPLLEEFEFDSSKKANQCTKTKKAAFVMLILSMTIGLIWISIKLTTSKSQAKILYIYTSTEATQPYMKAQVIDVNNQAFKCVLSDPPIHGHGDVIGLINGTIPIMCGGFGYFHVGYYHNNFTSLKSCFVLKNKTWTQTTDLLEGVFESGRGNVVINGSLLIHGGITGGDHIWYVTDYGTRDPMDQLDSVELVSPRHHQSLPKIPMTISNHCNMKVNSTTILVTGGSPNDSGNVSNQTQYSYPYDSVKSSNQTHFHDLVSGSWTQGPTMTMERARHACASFELKGRRIYVVGSKWNKTLEFLDSEDLDQGWQMINPLPSEMTTIVTSLDGKSVYALGHMSQVLDAQICQLQCTSQSLHSCTWKTLDRWSVGRMHGRDIAALPIPDAVASELCD